MQLKSKKHIGLMAVVIDEETEKAETIRVDTLQMMSFVINYATRQMMIAFAWGGYDSTGKFHMDPNRPASHRSINAEVGGEREIWQACAIDEKGNPRKAEEFGAVVEKVLFEHRKIDDVVNGGWNLEEVELTHKGDSVFKKEKPKK